MADRRRAVGEPVAPLRVTCRHCGTLVWQGDRAVTADATDLLADFADAACPIGGTAAGCPSTTEGQNIEREALPLTRIARLAERLDTLAARVTALAQAGPAEPQVRAKP